MYDFIIIGAGSAGCVMANRLSQDGSKQVLLLEAGGGDNQMNVKMPAAFSRLFKSDVDWAYETEPQPYCNNRKLFWPRGKMLGGSSSMNAMIYIRGNRQDYDRWAEMGNEEWGYDDVLPYFKRHERHEQGESAFHGASGELDVRTLRTVNPYTLRFVQSAVDIGFPRNNDFNGKQQEGFGQYHVNQRNGRRCSAAVAFLKPALKRPNLTVCTHAQATKLLFEGQRAVGVAFMHEGQMKEAQTAGEVILCGGAINSPKLLLLSGVGPADHLHEMEIPLVMDLPGVGQNLHDHPAIAVNFHVTVPGTLEDEESLSNMFRYLTMGRGPLTSNIGEAGGFIRTQPNLPLPNIQFHFAPAFFITHGFEKVKGRGLTIGPTLVQPHSRGYIRLRSSYPFVAPEIQPNYLEDARDLDALVAGLKVARDIMKAPAFNDVRGKEVYPGEAVQTDEELRDFVRSRVETLYHPVGSCKMGVDPMAVVDSKLQVHGVQGLRVADGSVMPTIVGGNTNAPIMMIAEKAADYILGK